MRRGTAVFAGSLEQWRGATYSRDWQAQQYSNEDNVRKRNLRHFLTKPQARLENTSTNMTFSMPRETAARLRDAAAARGTDLQGIIELAVAEWLARQTPISEILR